MLLTLMAIPDVDNTDCNSVLATFEDVATGMTLQRSSNSYKTYNTNSRNQFLYRVMKLINTSIST